MKIRRAINTIKFNLHNKTLFKYAFYHFFVMRSKDEERKERLRNKLFFNYKINYDSPKTFNEYLLWIKYYYQNDLWEECADKLQCKKFLIDKGFGEQVPKTLGIYKTSKEIDLSKLPEKFVLKTNGDSGSVFICEKGKTQFDEVFRKLDKSINVNYYLSTHEWAYKNVDQKIFAEELLISDSYNDMPDFKFFIFNGKYRFGFTAQNRSTDLRFGLFEKELEYLPCEYSHLKPKNKNRLKTENIKKMISIAEEVGSYFDFVRVDMYDTNNGPMIGELTFITMSGQGPFTKKKYDQKFGEYFKDTIFYKLAHKDNE